MKNFDRFCNQYNHLGIPNLIAIVMFGNAVVFFAGFIGLPVVNFLYLNPALILQGQIWRLVSFIFIPGSDGIWFVFFLLFYFWLGRMLEQQWGRLKFTLFYTSGMLFTILYSFLLMFYVQSALGAESAALVNMDANYLNLSMFLAAATLFPNMEIRLYFILPVKIKWLALVYAAFTLWSVISQRNLLPLAALGNYLLFFWRDLLDIYLRLTGRGGQSGGRSAGKPRLKILRTESPGDNPKTYRHKCVVCGATDLQHPDMEFRYCSLCKGSKCYCAKHIFLHDHQ